jgi:hypothetical protein
MIKNLLAIAAVTLALVGCQRDADVVSHNISWEADQFRVNRRVVFYNGVTGDYILTIEGLCSLGNNNTQGKLSVTCKVGHAEYKKHFLGLSDNVTFFAEQIAPLPASSYRYKVAFKPSVIIPDIEIR